MRRTLMAASAASIALLTLTGPAQAAGSVSYVSQADIAAVCPTVTDAGWCTSVRDTGTAAVAAGSVDDGDSTHLALSTPLGNDKATVKNVELVGEPLSAVGALAYRYAVTAPGSDPRQAPALTIEIDSNGLAAAGGFATLVYEPVYDDQNGSSTPQPVVLGAWQGRVASNATGEGGWWAPRNDTGALGFPNYTSGFADVLAALPDAVVYSVGVNQGSGNAGLVSEVDRLTFGGTTYDVGTAPLPRTPTARSECTQGGWQDFDAPTFRNQGQCVSFVAASRNR